MPSSDNTYSGEAGAGSDPRSPRSSPNDPKTSPFAPPLDVSPKVAEIPLAADIPLEDRLKEVKASQNPLLKAARPLLRALADTPDLPKTLDAQAVTIWRRLLEREVKTFQLICEKVEIRHEHAVAASYALCTALDEAASSTAWGGAANGKAGMWADRMLAQQFHEDSEGGEKVFLLIGRIAANHVEHIDLIEVMFMILSLGFEGRYGLTAKDRQQHEVIRRRLAALLESVRGPVPTALSPHLEGAPKGRFPSLYAVPVWVTAVAASLALLAMFGWYKYQLNQLSAEVIRSIEVSLIKPPPMPPAKLLRLRELLSAEIARGTVTVEEDEHRSAVSFKGDDMFVPGQARLSPHLVPVLAKVADEINLVPGTVYVAGHSDNRPIKTREFPDNHALSEKRAAAVAEVLQGKGVVASRMRIEGRGDTAPVADNATAAGRAKNRRVDIVVMQRNAPLPLK